MVEKWQPELEEFKETRENYLLYESSNLDEEQRESPLSNSNTIVWTIIGGTILAGLGVLCYIKQRKE
ncbi:hypothetical protein [Tetragenococcus muriaticus]|uniref:hypothetical protein n=1 Tax=Tetragenococcus muriaticus TaxID=64642 RepID=UPI0039C5F0B5